MIIRGEFFVFHTGLTLFHALHILTDIGHVPLAVPSVEGMCGSTQSYVGCLVPVTAVMTRMTTRLPPVADFIMLKTSLSQRIHQPEIHLSLQFLVYLAHLASLQHPVERCSFLILQRIGREMFYVQRYGLLDITLPLRHRLVGKPVHQIHADIPDTYLTQTSYSLLHLFGRMATTQEAQTLWLEGLSPH